MKICPNCGKLSENNFCPDCGTNLSEVPELDQTEDLVQESAPEISDEVISNNGGEGVQQYDPDENEAQVNEEENLSDNNELNENDAAGEGEENLKLQAESVTNDSESINSSDQIQAAVQSSPKKGTKKGLIIGGIIAAVILAAIVIITSQPKLVSIDAAYNGSNDKGTVINNDAAITVTGTYDDDSTKEVTGWTVNETTLKPGWNNFDVTYEDKTTNVMVYSPLMAGGKIIASVDEIQDVLYSYNNRYLTGFSGFEKDEKVDGKYNYKGTGVDLSVSYTKKSGSENVGVDGSESPETMIVTSILMSDNFKTYSDDIFSAGASALATLDPDFTYDEAYSQIRKCTVDAIDSASGAVASHYTYLDNLTIATGMVLANGKLLLFYSIQS